MKLFHILPKFLFILILSISTTFASEVTMLNNGIKLINIKRDFTQTVTITFFIKGGVVRETENNNGVGSMFARVWLKSSPLLEILEFYGGAINASVNSDFFESSLSLPTEHLDKLLNPYSDLILKPVFNADYFERERQFQLEEIKAADDSPQQKAFKGFLKATYDNGPYSLTSEGTEKSLKNLKIEDIKNYYNDMFNGANITVAVAGNFSDIQLEHIKNIFSQIKTGEKYDFQCSDFTIKETKKIEEEDKRSEQAKMFVGYNAPNARHEDYTPLKVLNEILGGGMSSRYFSVLRKDHGFAYSVGTFFSSKLCSSRFTGYIGLEYSNTEKAQSLMEDINKNASQNIDVNELEKAKNSILGRTLIESQTNSKTAWYACFYENLNLGYDYFDKYVNEVRAVTAEQVKHVAKKYLLDKKTTYILK